MYSRRIVHPDYIQALDNGSVTNIGYLSDYTEFFGIHAREDLVLMLKGRHFDVGDDADRARWSLLTVLKASRYVSNGTG